MRAVGPVEDLDEVQHADVGAVGAQPGLDLQNAARIGGDDRLGPRGEHVADLAVQQPRRHLGLREVVDPGRAAAPVRLGQLDEPQPGHLGQEPRGSLLIFWPCTT